jgi:hypothetical protein
MLSFYAMTPHGFFNPIKSSIHIFPPKSLHLFQIVEVAAAVFWFWGP